MLYRVTTLVRKELQALLQDKQGRVLLIVPVLLQTLIFPFAATLEVKNNVLGILNEDTGPESMELIQRLVRAEAFTEIVYLFNETELQSAVDNQRTLLALRFPADFSRSVLSGKPATIQAILDGRRSNSGQIALGYARRILREHNLELASGEVSPPAPSVVVRHWYNPNLDYVRHIIPSLVAIITTISSLIVTSLSVAREREQGTFDQLLVSPLTPGMIMIGKGIPAIIVAMAQAGIVISAGVFAYRIPFEGSLLVLYAGMFFYLLALVGFGLLISSICATQQQAFLGVFSFMSPAVLLSGFPSPVENMPVWLQHLNWFNPLQHFIVIVKGVFIKDAPVELLLPRVLPLILIAAITLTAADLMFRRRVG
jgi:ABC-2 type transport system permease protein